mgnify:CR=1 FL=1
MNYLKKIRNLTIKLTEILFIKITKKKYWSEKITISSFLNGEIKLKYLSNKLGFIFFFQKKIGRYHFDASLADTELCMIGKKFQTDKSPFNETMHRHPYTPIYHLLFNSLRFKRINLAEIGILNNSSIKMWREYFPKAKIFGFSHNANETRAIYKSDKDIDKYARAVASYLSGDHDISINILEQLIANNPDNPYFRELIAEIHFSKHNYELAIKYQESSINLLNEENDLYYMMIGNYYLANTREEDYPESIKFLKKSLVYIDGTISFNPFSYLSFSFSFSS